MLHVDYLKQSHRRLYSIISITLLRFQVQNTMDRTHGRFFIYWAVISVNVLSFSAGVAYSWSSPSLPKLSSHDPQVNPLFRPTTIFENSWIAAILSLGCIFGSLSSGMVSTSFGRKKTLIMFSLPMILCYVLIALAETVNVLYVARFLLGLGTGCIYSVLPSYVGEISEDSNRGFLGNFMGVSLSLGSAFSYVVGPFVSVRMFSIFQLVSLCIVFFTFVPFVPESPYYFVSINDHQNAQESLKKLRGRTGPTVQKELIYIKEYVEETRSNNVPLRDVLNAKSSRRGLAVIVGLMVCQQLCGICAVLSYMQSIFESTGTNIPPEIAPIPVTTIQTVSMFISTFLVERLGRKPLLLISSSGVCLALASLGTYYFLEDNDFDTSSIFWLPLLSLVSFSIFFNIGMASIPWTLSGELFPSNVKAIAASISSCVCFVGSFSITMGFPYMTLLLGMAGSFWFFAVCAGFTFVFIIVMVPETRGKSFSEIEMMLNSANKI
ncbi:unnamed protein product [Phaedon cochleariae]|uniref:Sugar transporter n=1 Tax=Phaedon cochleariae TaxID=80249 RepID=A0A9P0DWJ6_PHACE|nr:unnamed protein product [Phaedon cochleariae]